MDASWTRKALPAAHGMIRCGRPRRELAGEVEERILDAAGKVFLERGFEGASVEEIAEVARAGKPTIYTRYASKEALFSAVVARKVRANTSIERVTAMGSTIEQRLEAIASVLLGRILSPESIGLMRAVVAEARRFPDLAISVKRQARDLGIEFGGPPFGRSRAVRRNGRLAGLRPRPLVGDRAPLHGRHCLPHGDAGVVRGRLKQSACRDRASRKASSRVLSRRVQTRSAGF